MSSSVSEKALACEAGIGSFWFVASSLGSIVVLCWLQAQRLAV